MLVTSSARAQLGIRLASVVLLAALAAPFAQAGMNTGRGAEPSGKITPERPQPTYAVHVGLNGEIFPFLANYASFQHPQERKWGTISVTITNTGDAMLSNRIAVQILGWSDQEIQLAELKPGQVRTLLFAPSFLPRFYQNHEIAAATAAVEITDAGRHTEFSTTVPVRLRAAGDMYWGSTFKYAPFIASWVTPHNPRVEAVLSRAKEFMPGRRLPGYQPSRDRGRQAKSTYQQVRAIYRALQETGISYVKSSMTFGAAANTSSTERVRCHGSRWGMFPPTALMVS